MRGNYPLTRPKMHRALLQLLAHDEVRLTYKGMVKREGFADWDDIMPPTNITILVDANTNPLDHVSAVIHELLHVTLYPSFVGRLADDYLEVAVLAFERDMWAYVKRSPARLAKWYELIQRKLERPLPEVA